MGLRPVDIYFATVTKLICSAAKRCVHSGPNRSPQSTGSSRGENPRRASVRRGFSYSSDQLQAVACRTRRHLQAENALITFALLSVGVYTPGVERKHTEETMDYPEHDKLMKIRDKSQAIGEFVEWLAGQGIHFGTYDDFDRFQMVRADIQGRLAEYFEIDLNRLEAEKRAMLEFQRRLNEQTTQ